MENDQTAAGKGGPKTEEGKKISRHNATKHGLLSQEILIEDENAKDLATLGSRLEAELEPVNALELLLVDRIIANAWRLKRALRVEREMIVDDYMGKRDDLFRGESSLGKAFSYDLANYDTYGKLLRYETSIERGLYRALHELQRLQAARKGQDVPLPAVVDVNVDGSLPSGE